MVGWLVGVGRGLWVRLGIQIPMVPFLLDFPLPFKNSNSCNPTSTIHDTKKLYLSIGVVEGSQACNACWAGLREWVGPVPGPNIRVLGKKMKWGWRGIDISMCLLKYHENVGVLSIYWRKMAILIEISWLRYSPNMYHVEGYWYISTFSFLNASNVGMYAQITN